MSELGEALVAANKNTASSVVAIMMERAASKTLTEVKYRAIQLAIELADAGIIDSFADFEVCLREEGGESELFLVAVPLNHYGEQWASQIEYPWKKEDPYYAAQLCTSIQEADELYRRYELTYEENLRRLCFAGLPSNPAIC